jgi:hypothetical protein
MWEMSRLEDEIGVDGKEGNKCKKENRRRVNRALEDCTYEVRISLHIYFLCVDVH